jgi:hypothetical protein
MNCSWVFLSQDETVQRVTLEEQAIPSLGDGKLHAGKGYEVIFVGKEMTSHEYPLVLAVEHMKKSCTDQPPIQSA